MPLSVPLSKITRIRPAAAHPLDRLGELVASMEDVGVLGEEAEDQPGHEVVHVGAAIGCGPLGVILEERDVELVEAPRGADVEAALADLGDRGGLVTVLCRSPERLELESRRPTR
jgi:hypothetical protein